MNRLLVLIPLLCTLVACDARHDVDTQPPVSTEQPVPAVVMPVPGGMESTAVLIPAPGTYLIDLSPDNVTIRAQQVDEIDLLYNLAEIAGFRLLVGDGAWRIVTVDIKAETLHLALGELIKAHPYQMIYTPDKETLEDVLSEVVVGDMPLPVAIDEKGTAAAEEDMSSEETEEITDEQHTYIQDMESEIVEVRVAAVGKIDPDGDALYILIDTLANDPSPEVRIATTEALEFSEDPLAIQALVACFDDEDLYVLIECITALAQMGDKANVADLQPMLQHYDEAVRNTAASAIEALQ